MSPPRSLIAVFVLTGLAVAAPTLALAKGKAKPVDEGPTFNREAAAASLKSVDLIKCKVSGGPRGEGHVAVTFGSSGAVSGAVVDRGPYVKSPVERCIVAAYMKAQVPAFHGDAVTVGKSFRID